ncbi:MAG: hypothetical protein WAV05_06210 [Anaerolineales bacterium]
MYSQLPYNYYSTNIDTVIADACFLGKAIYSQLSRTYIPKQADEIYQSLIGKMMCLLMAEKFAGFEEPKFGEKNATNLP